MKGNFRFNCEKERNDSVDRKFILRYAILIAQKLVKF